MSWSRFSLGDLGSFFGGVTSISKGDYGWGTPFLTYKNVFSNSKVDTSDFALMNVKPSDLEKRSCVYGDIFFTASSETPDEVAMSSVLLDAVDNLTFNGFTKRFRLHDFDTLLPEFARYLFRGAAFRTSAYEAATGDVRFNISQESLSKISVLLPPLEEQRSIAATLSALDDKVESNRRAVATALALARAHVDRAIEGKPVVSYSEALEVQMGAAFKGQHFTEPGTGRPLLRIRDLKTFESQTWTTEVRKDETVVHPGDVVVGMDAEFRATLWLGLESILNQRVCSFRGRDGVGRSFVLAALEPELAFQEQAKTGTTVIHLNKADIDTFTVPCLSMEEHQALSNITEPLIDLAVSRAAEARLLTRTRNVLLPDLLSGRIRAGAAGLEYVA